MTAPLDHMMILPVILPAMVAAFLVIALRHHLKGQRIVSIAVTLLLTGVAAILFAQASDGTVRAYRLGDWPAPYGITLVLDRLSATLLLLTAALPCVWWSMQPAAWTRGGATSTPCSSSSSWASTAPS